MAGTIKGRVNYNWHTADDVLVRSKVRYLSNFSAAPHFGERLESARLAHCPEPRRRSLDRAETGRSALVMGTALHAPGRVKTCASQESVEPFSLLLSSDSHRQHFWFSD